MQIGRLPIAGLPRLPLSAPRQRIARQARSGVSAAAQNHRRARLLLAFARLPALSDSLVAPGVLVVEVAKKCAAGQGERAQTAAGGLEGARGVGMPDRAARFVGTKNRAIFDGAAPQGNAVRDFLSKSSSIYAEGVESQSPGSRSAPWERIAFVFHPKRIGSAGRQAVARTPSAYGDRRSPFPRVRFATLGFEIQRLRRKEKPQVAPSRLLGFPFSVSSTPTNRCAHGGACSINTLRAAPHAPDRPDTAADRSDRRRAPLAG